MTQGNKFTEMIKSNYSKEKIVLICADIEDQIMGLDKNERETFMKEVGLNKTGLNQLIKGYDLLNLDTFSPLVLKKVELGQSKKKYTSTKSSKCNSY